MPAPKDKNPLADSAGVPWAGRELSANLFAEDDGTARPELISAIKKFHQSLDPAEVFTEFARSRILIPLVAQLGESEIGAHGKTVDKSAELSLVSVQTPDDQVGLPVFSSVEAMKLWNQAARPVPNDAVRVALAAASEGSTRIILDPGSSTEFAFRRAAIAALAQSQPWQAPYLDDAVVAAYQSGVSGEVEVLKIEIGTADPYSRLAGAEVRVLLEVRSGLEKPELEALLQRVTANWSNSAAILTAVDSMSLLVKPAKSGN